MNYLLTTGEITDKPEIYILDLFRLNFTVYPGDIPGNKGIGFNYLFTDTKKDEIESELRSRLKGLVSKMQEQFGSFLKINLDKVEILSEDKASIIMSVGEIKSEELILNL